MNKLEHDTRLARSLHRLAVPPSLYNILATVALHQETTQDKHSTRARIALHLGVQYPAVAMVLQRHAALFKLDTTQTPAPVTLSQEGITLLCQIHQQ
jgi:hypothetical protein